MASRFNLPSTIFQDGLEDDDSSQEDPENALSGSRVSATGRDDRLSWAPGSRTAVMYPSLHFLDSFQSETEDLESIIDSCKTLIRGTRSSQGAGGLTPEPGTPQAGPEPVRCESRSILVSKACEAFAELQSAIANEREGLKAAKEPTSSTEEIGVGLSKIPHGSTGMEDKGSSPPKVRPTARSLVKEPEEERRGILKPGYDKKGRIILDSRPIGSKSDGLSPRSDKGVRLIVRQPQAEPKAGQNDLNMSDVITLIGTRVKKLNRLDADCDNSKVARVPDNIATKMLCGIISKALDDMVAILEKAKKPQRQYSYNAVIDKLERAKLIFGPTNPLEEDPAIKDRGLGSHGCELALQAAQQLDPEAGWDDILKATTQVRSCKLKALAGLSLFFCNSATVPDWDLLARLWFDAKTTVRGEYSTTFLESILGARTSLLARSRSLEAYEAAYTAACPENKSFDKAKTVDRVVLASMNESCNASIPQRAFAAPHVLNANVDSLGDRSYRQWIHLNYQVGNLTLKHFCQRLAARHVGRETVNPKEKFETYKKKWSSQKLVEEVIPNLVEDIIHRKLEKDFKIQQEAT